MAKSKPTPAAEKGDRGVSSKMAADSVSWLRLAVVAVAGLLGFLLAGIPQIHGAWLFRGVIAGLIVGLSARGLREMPWCLGIAASIPLLSGVIASSKVGGPPLSLDTLSILMAIAASVSVCFFLAWMRLVGSGVAASSIAVVIVVGIFLYCVGFFPGEVQTSTAGLRRSLAIEPVAEHYDYDGWIFLRTEFLMEKGVPYYPAYIKAWSEDKRLSGTPPVLFNIRQRWLFELWKALPGAPGIKVWQWFLVMTLATMLAGYGLARRFVEPFAALLAPILIAGYFTMPAVTERFPLTEFWAGCVGVWFLYEMVHERWTAAAFVLAFAFALRELMLFLVPVYVAWWLFSGRKREGLPGLVIVIAGPTLLFWMHSLWSPVGTGGSSGLDSWLQGSPARLKEVITFSAQHAIKGSLLYLVVPMLALVAALATRAAWTRVLLGSAAIVPLLSLSIFSNGEFGVYWGAIMMPLLMAISPIAAGLVAPRSLAVLDSPPKARPRKGMVRVVLDARGADPQPLSAAEALRSALRGRESSLSVLHSENGDLPAGEVSRLRSLGVSLVQAQAGSAIAGCIAEALKESSAEDAILLADASIGIDACTFEAMVNAFDEGADVVVGSRLVAGSRLSSSLPRRVLDALGTRAISAVLRRIYPMPGLRDYSGTAVLYSASALKLVFRGEGGRTRSYSSPHAVSRLRGIARVCEVPLVAARPAAVAGAFRSVRDLLHARAVEFAGEAA